MAFGICGAGPVSTCKVHEFVLVRVIACLLSFYLFRLAARNGSSHCIGPKKNRRHYLFVFFVPSFVRLLTCLIACLFVCLVLFSFVFLISFDFFDSVFSLIMFLYILPTPIIHIFVNARRFFLSLCNHKKFQNS